jgi:hypothetical protein
VKYRLWPLNICDVTSFQILRGIDQKNWRGLTKVGYWRLIVWKEKTIPGVNPLKLFAPEDEFTNSSQSGKTCFDSENV